jgi:hypothetical protein
MESPYRVPAVIKPELRLIKEMFYIPPWAVGYYFNIAVAQPNIEDVVSIISVPRSLTLKAVDIKKVTGIITIWIPPYLFDSWIEVKYLKEGYC